MPGMATVKKKIGYYYFMKNMEEAERVFYLRISLAKARHGYTAPRRSKMLSEIHDLLYEEKDWTPSIDIYKRVMSKVRTSRPPLELLLRELRECGAIESEGYGKGSFSRFGHWLRSPEDELCGMLAHYLADCDGATAEQLRSVVPAVFEFDEWNLVGLVNSGLAYVEDGRYYRKESR